MCTTRALLGVSPGKRHGRAKRSNVVINKLDVGGVKYVALVAFGRFSDGDVAGLHPHAV